jgi:hypothetical protein
VSHTLKRLIALLALASSPLAAHLPAPSIFAAASAAAPQVSGQAQAPQPALQRQIQMPPPEAMIILIRAHLVALSQANQTNNYTVLNGLGSADFRKANPPERLSQIFAPFRTNNIDLAPVVFITPQLSQQPIMENGRLRLIGFFPTQPMRLDYDLTFEPSNGVWRLFGLSVNLTNVAPTSQPKPQR